MHIKVSVEKCLRAKIHKGKVTISFVRTKYIRLFKHSSSLSNTLTAHLLIKQVGSSMRDTENDRHSGSSFCVNECTLKKKCRKAVSISYIQQE